MDYEFQNNIPRFAKQGIYINIDDKQIEVNWLERIIRNLLSTFMAVDSTPVKCMKLSLKTLQQHYSEIMTVPERNLTIAVLNNLELREMDPVLKQCIKTFLPNLDNGQINQLVVELTPEQEANQRVLNEQLKKALEAEDRTEAIRWIDKGATITIDMVSWYVRQKEDKDFIRFIILRYTGNIDAEPRKGFEKPLIEAFDSRHFHSGDLLLKRGAKREFLKKWIDDKYGSIEKYIVRSPLSRDELNFLRRIYPLPRNFNESLLNNELDVACEKGSLQEIKLALFHGANVSIDMLSWYSRQGKKEVVALLLPFFNGNLDDPRANSTYNTPLIEAFDSFQTDIMMDLISKGAKTESLIDWIMKNNIKLDEHIQKINASASPLTDEQLNFLNYFR